VATTAPEGGGTRAYTPSSLRADGGVITALLSGAGGTAPPDSTSTRVRAGSARRSGFGDRETQRLHGERRVQRVGDRDGFLDDPHEGEELVTKRVVVLPRG
jgi:hypothetical protein